MEGRELPVGWVIAPLGDLATFEMGQAPPGAASNFSGDGEVFVKAGEFGERHPVVREWTTKPLKYATNRDVLICVVGATAGKLNLGIDCAIGRSVAAIRPSAALDQLGLYFQLLISVLSLRASSTGSAQGVISKKMLADILIALPPINEQRRIAAKLDTTLAAVEACRQRLDGVAAILKRFRQAVLAAATSGELTREWRGERGGSLNDWANRRVEDVVTAIEAGLNVQCEERPPEDHERGLVKISAVTWGIYDEQESKTLSKSAVVLEKNRIQVGDFLISRANTIELVGSCVLVDKTSRNLYLSDKVLRLVMPQEWKLWLLWCLKSPAGRKQIEKLSSGNQLSMRNLSQKSLLSISIKLPPADELEKIVTVTNDLLSLADQLEARLNAARKIVDRLTPALLAKAFRGELVPQDPADEPASVLLAKLKSTQADALHVSPRRRAKQLTRRETMSIPDKDSVKAAILTLKSDRFSFDELRHQAGGDYETLKGILFQLLEEPSPVVRQVFDQEAKAMKLERIRP